MAEQRDSGANRALAEQRLLRLLSVDARMTMQGIASELKVTKGVAYDLLNDIVSRRGLRFSPELNLDSLWRLEFVRQARMQTKKGIIGEAAELIASAGFGEYLTTIRFTDGKPSDEEIRAALGDAYMPQFVATTKGKFDVFIYSIARGYEEMRYMFDKFSEKLRESEMLIDTSRVWGTYGFFPLGDKLIEQFNIFDTYKNLIAGLNGDGRANFSELGRKFNLGPTQMLYAYERLKHTETLRRMTYYESKPQSTASEIIRISVTNAKAFEKSKEQWLLNAVNYYRDKPNEYTFMCDTTAPNGMIAIVSAETSKRAKEIVSSMESKMKGARVESTSVASALKGNLGIRDFDMRYSAQYRFLVSKGLAERFNPKLSRDAITENPEM